MERLGNPSLLSARSSVLPALAGSPGMTWRLQDSTSQLLLRRRSYIFLAQGLQRGLGLKSSRERREKEYSRRIGIVTRVMVTVQAFLIREATLALFPPPEASQVLDRATSLVEAIDIICTNMSEW